MLQGGIVGRGRGSDLLLHACARYRIGISWFGGCNTLSRLGAFPFIGDLFNPDCLWMVANETMPRRVERRQET